MLVIVLISSINLHAGEFLPDLVKNYSNFSYIHAVAVGFKYVYFGTTNGVTRYNIAKKQWDSPLTGFDGLYDSEILGLKASFDDEHIWVRTESGHYEYTAVFNRWTPIDQIPDEVTNGEHIDIDFDYIPPKGYYYLNTGILVDIYNNEYPIGDVVNDGWGNHWIATWGLGAFRSDNSARILEPLTFGLLQQDITKIYPDNGTLLMGGSDSGFIRPGLTAFNWEENLFNHIKTEPGLFSFYGQVNAIAASENKIFVGTSDGLLIVDKKENKIIDHIYQKSGLPDNRILSLLVHDNILYVGTEYGLGIIDTRAGFYKSSSKTKLPTHAILSLDYIDNYIWIGTHQGTFRLNLLSEKLGYLKSPEISGKREVRFVKHTDKKIWLGIDYELKSIDINSAEVEDYPEILQYKDVRAIAVSDTIVAVATSEGLAIIIDSYNDSHFLFTTNDGLMSNDIRDLVFDGDYIWLGTDKGLIRFWYKRPNLY